MKSTLTDMLATAKDSALAIAAPGRPPLSHGALRDLVQRTLAMLNAHGIGRNDRLAIVLANGPEMATCFISAACGVATAPLNPAYRADEFEFYLSDLNAKALVVEHDSQSPAIAVAQKLGVRLIDLWPGEAAGDFTLRARDGLPGTPTVQGGPAQPDDISMVLHTSGTTSRPKIVPLSQRNLCTSAGNIARTLQFSASDIGLNIMPLFHIHGSDCRCAGAAGRGFAGLLHAGLQRAEILWLDGRSQTHLVHRRAHHAPGHRGAGQQEQGHHPAPPAALHSQQQQFDAAAGHPRAGRGVWRAADRSLWHDRSHAPDGQQPLAAGCAQARQCGPGRRPRSGHHG
jgi:acyl-CoA synthetase (AMP-forming)/AMP-acid ligase II